MTDLHALADAISNQSPKIKAFCEAVADLLQPENPADTAFQRAWDAATMPLGSWDAPQVATTAAQFDSLLSTAKAGARIQPRGFVYNNRLRLTSGGPLWIDADPTFEIVGPSGAYGQGVWAVGCTHVYVTGLPRVHNCGNQGLLDQSSTACYFELDVRDCGGTGMLANTAPGLTPVTRTVYKIQGGNNGLDLTLDPHPQKGTGNHFANVWQLASASVLLDIDTQPYGAGLESCALNGCTVAIRAKDLACDVNTLPPGPNGERQTGGNAWQPWDGGAPGLHIGNTVAAIAVGSCAQAVYGALSSTGNYGNVVTVGRCASHRLSPAWAPLPGVTYGDVA